MRNLHFVSRWWDQKQIIQSLVEIELQDRCYIIDRAHKIVQNYWGYSHLVPAIDNLSYPQSYRQPMPRWDQCHEQLQIVLCDWQPDH